MHAWVNAVWFELALLAADLLALAHASTSELAGFELSRQMYRRERDASADLHIGRTANASAHRRGRVSPFLPAGTALAVCLLLPTGTAVAAYTGRLPAST